ncbi:PIN domain-containing protein [Candidatus Woesearchaeota archaeon]|nr:PIN domain-containing protein [Candidatus Woesearchaeota archaeon]
MTSANYSYIIDSSAWIEYFGGNQKSIKIKDIIENELIATSIIAIAEVADKFERENRPLNQVLNFIQSRAAILPLTFDIALLAAKLKKEIRKRNSKFGLTDALHLATASKENSIFITTDNDFSGLSKVVII